MDDSRRCPTGKTCEILWHDMDEKREVKLKKSWIVGIWIGLKTKERGLPGRVSAVELFHCRMKGLIPRGEF